MAVIEWGVFSRNPRHCKEEARHSIRNQAWDREAVRADIVNDFYNVPFKMIAALLSGATIQGIRDISDSWKIIKEAPEDE